MKRVGILTLYYKTYNFGAQLQAYALQKTIEDLGYECEQIRFIWSKEETIENYSNASINQTAFAEFSNRIKHSERIYDVCNISECLEDYDAFIVGSDQVWGVENSMPLTKLPVMTLSFTTKDKVKIAYAASMGGAIPSSKIEEVLKSELNNFDAISVREKSAAEYLSEIFKIKVETVLDPVFIRELEEWRSISNLVGEEKRPYIFYYTAGADSRQEEIIDGISKILGYDVKRLGYIAGEKIGPEEFVALIRDAKYVVTDSFHASVLSILFHKQFVVLPVDNVPTNRSRNIRIQDMLRTFRLDDRYVEYNQGVTNIVNYLNDKLNDEIAYHNVDIILEDNRKNSINFLKNALSIKKEKEEYLESYENCTGCGACYKICPIGAIEMKLDEFGFVYPVRDRDKCILCGRCKEVCGYKISYDYEDEIIGLQSVDANERKNSYVGGVFYELASFILKNNGIVVACKYDSEFNVVHDFCNSIVFLDDFCGSKYVQSNAYNTFPKIKEILEEGKKVMFVGTPCQTASLVAFLGSNPDNLYLLDVVCGGVGAPALWNKYIEYKKSMGELQNIKMQYTDFLKPEGFSAFSMKIDYTDRSEIYDGEQDLYLSSVSSFERESCYLCRYKGNNSGSDITISDFVANGNGTTLTIVHTLKGQKLISDCSDRFKCIKICDKKEILNRNATMSECMRRKNQHYYMRSIFENSSIERIFYEDKFWDEFNAKEVVLRNYFNEVKRNELLLKVERFIQYRLWIDDDSRVRGRIFIYGAGKLGRSLVKCTRNMVGFIDGNTNLKSCEGYKVYHLGTQELDKVINSGVEITVIITLVWDFDELQDKLNKVFPTINVISAKDLVGNIWI